MAPRYTCTVLVCLVLSSYSFVNSMSLPLTQDTGNANKEFVPQTGEDKAPVSKASLGEALSRLLAHDESSDVEDEEKIQKLKSDGDVQEKLEQLSALLDEIESERQMDEVDGVAKRYFDRLTPNLIDKRYFDRLTPNLPDKRYFDRLTPNLPDKRYFDRLTPNLPDKRYFDRLTPNLPDKRYFDRLTPNLPDKRSYGSLKASPYSSLNADSHAISPEAQELLDYFKEAGRQYNARE